MNPELLIGLVGTLLLGVGAQWLAWRLHFPAIVLLLLTGFAAGPLLGVIRPDGLFGETLFPIVSLSVAIILFEGGLSLNYKELRQAGRPVLGLTTLGIVVTALLTALGARMLFHWPWSMAALMGGILSVTGPTVVLPMLRMIRPTGQVGSILKWEGILNDPIGALLAVLIYDAIRIGDFSQAFPVVAKSFFLTIATGVIAGGLGAGLVILMVKRFWAPDFLQNPLSLALVLASFATANRLQPESGLLAVTVMGVALGNQPWVPLREMVAFKENLRVLLLSSLFILLSARVNAAKLLAVHHETFLFLGWLIFVVRPATVWVATRGTSLTSREKFFLSALAPRGIVAAAVASVFSLELVRAGHPSAEVLEGVTFVVIVGLATFYGLLAPWLARKYGLAQANPQGVLFVGAHPFARAIARVLQEEDVRVLLVDTNHDNIRAARMEGLPAVFTSILSPSANELLDMEGLGNLVAVTSNDEVNALSALRFRDQFSRSRVFQLSPAPGQMKRHEALADDFRARYLFAPEATFHTLTERFDAGALIKRTKLTAEFDFDKWLLQSEGALPLFSVDDKKRLTVFTPDVKTRPLPGHAVISLSSPSMSPAGSQ